MKNMKSFLDSYLEYFSSKSIFQLIYGHISLLLFILRYSHIDLSGVYLGIKCSFLSLQSEESIHQCTEMVHVIFLPLPPKRAALHKLLVDSDP